MVASHPYSYMVGGQTSLCDTLVYLLWASRMASVLWISVLQSARILLMFGGPAMNTKMDVFWNSRLAITVGSCYWFLLVITVWDVMKFSSHTSNLDLCGGHIRVHIYQYSLTYYNACHYNVDSTWTLTFVHCDWLTELTWMNTKRSSWSACETDAFPRLLWLPTISALLPMSVAG